MSLTLTSNASSFRAPALWGIYLKETHYELLKLVRHHSYLFSIIGIPIGLFLLFGVAHTETMLHGYPITRYLIASYSCFGGMGAAMFAVGGGLAYERGHGWLELKRASPMPTFAYLFAKLVSSVVFGELIAMILLAIGASVIDLQMSAWDIAHFMLAVAGGVMAFAAIGTFVGLLLAPGSAAGMINLIYLPLALCGGLWMPLEALPNWLQAIAPILPSYHFSRLALHTLGYFNESEALSWGWLALYTLVFAAAGTWLFRRQEAAR
jgi:ABC-2 type transport system permease protein